MQRAWGHNIGPKMKTIEIFLEQTLPPSEVVIGHGIGLSKHLTSSAERFAVIVDEKIANGIGKQIAESLGGELFPFSGGERAKTRETKALLEDQLQERGFGRDCAIVAVGGGVTTDLAGFVAATFCRGVPFIAIPTTLLAMVDSAIGGKVGVNTPRGKNLIGAFYPARKIICDTALLHSLPESEWKNGMSEIIKHACIGSPALFQMLRERHQEWNRRDPDFLIELICQNVEIKKKFVQADFRDQVGKRAALNFGHTIGHALEASFDYRLSHGHAVALGMRVEAWLSRHLGTLEQAQLENILELIELYQLPKHFPGPFDVREIFEKMGHDKKNRLGHPHVVFLKTIGQIDRLDKVDEEWIGKGLAWAEKNFE
jgi:3-dehydroquinate synthase